MAVFSSKALKSEVLITDQSIGKIYKLLILLCLHAWLAGKSGKNARILFSWLEMEVDDRPQPLGPALTHPRECQRTQPRLSEAAALDLKLDQTMISLFGGTKDPEEPKAEE